jgi:hypothetical protein
MKPTKVVLVLGSGHLATRTRRKLVEAGYTIRNIESTKFLDRARTEVDEASLTYTIGILKRNGVGRDRLLAVCIVDKEDRWNVRLLSGVLKLQETAPIIAALSNENLLPDIGSAHANVRIVNPPREAIPQFLAALHAPPTESEQSLPRRRNGRFRGNRYWSGFPMTLILFVLILLAAGTLFFHWSEGLTWLDSAYYEAVVMTGVGFGDTPIGNVAVLVRLIRLACVLCTWFWWQMIVPAFFIGWLVSRSVERNSYGRRRYRLRNHIIVAGLGKFGYHLADALLRNGERVIVVESSEGNPFIEAFRAKWGKRARVLIRKANMVEYLVDASIARAKGLIATVHEDDINLEIASIARGLRPNLRVVIRLFDATLANVVSEVHGFDFAVSTSDVASACVLAHLNGLLATQ